MELSVSEDVDNTASGAILGALAFNSVLEMFTSVAHSRAWYSLIELSIFATSAGFHALRSAGCELLIDANNPESASLVISTWFMIAPAFAVLLWLITRVHWVWPVVASTAHWAIHCSRGVMLLPVPERVRATALLCRVCAALTFFSSLGFMMRRLILQMIQAKQRSKAIALVFALASFCLTLVLHITLLRLELDGARFRAARRVANVLLVTGAQTVLVRAALVSNAARMDVRQLEVMRAIESSTSYKTAADMRAAIDQRDAFMAAVSHELRTPLNGVIGLTEGLLRESFGPLTDAMRRQLHVVRASGHRLLSMINGVLDSSAARIEKLAIRQETLALREIVADVTQLLRVTMKPGVALVNDVPGSCRVRGDADRLVQILNNLLANAAKFTHEGEVRVSADRLANMWAVRVADTGIGIPAERFDAIFNAFEQVDSTVAKSYGGFGLGLHIARDLVHAHGGRMGVESALREGTTFTFTLPDASAPTTAPAKAGSDAGAHARGGAPPSSGAASQSSARVSFERSRHASGRRFDGLHPAGGERSAARSGSSAGSAPGGSSPAAARAARHHSSHKQRGQTDRSHVPHAFPAGALAAQNVLSGDSVARSRALPAADARLSGSTAMQMPAAAQWHSSPMQQLRHRRQHAAPDAPSPAAGHQRLQAWLSASGNCAADTGWLDPFAEGAPSLQARQTALLAAQGSQPAPAVVPGSICDRFRHCTFPQLAQSAPALGLQHSAGVAAAAPGALHAPGPGSADASCAMSAPMRGQNDAPRISPADDAR